jgi:hypothetical protein
MSDHDLTFMGGPADGTMIPIETVCRWEQAKKRSLTMIRIPSRKRSFEQHVYVRIRGLPMCAFYCRKKVQPRVLSDKELKEVPTLFQLERLSKK